MEGQTRIISNNGTATATSDDFSSPDYADEQVTTTSISIIGFFFFILA